MTDRAGLFAGDNPFEIARTWLAHAEAEEINDPNAIALSTVDSDGLPNARMVLLKEIEDEAFVFYTNYGSAQAQELDSAGKAAFVMHWTSLRRQVRARVNVVDTFGVETVIFSQATNTVKNVNNKPAGKILVRRVGN